jgi:DUF4097 and DUF4098 domain-containing protein YvlB
MKTLSATFAAIFLAAWAMPGQTPSMSCEHQGNNNRPGFCEVRESTITASALTVDGQTNGGISIKGADRPDILVRAMVQSQGESEADARNTGAQVIVHTSGGAVQSDGPKTKNWSVSYEIFIPRHTNLSLKTNNGGVSISGVESTVEFHAVNGGISLKDVGGYVHGETVNGGVSVSLAGASWTGQGLDVSTSNGGVSMKVPEQFSALLDVATVNGGMSIKMPNAPQLLKGEHHFNATVGTGGPLIRVRTHNGGVSISGGNSKA